MTDKLNLDDTLFPSSSVVVEVNRNVSLWNALYSVCIFFVMTTAYVSKRKNGVWRSNVPYIVPITVLGKDDKVKTIPIIPPIYQVNKMTMLQDFVKYTGCTEVLHNSPQCECYESFFKTSVLDDPKLTGANYPTKYIDFKKSVVKMCDEVRPAFTVEVLDGTGSVVFDIILIWWTFATITALCNTYMFSTVTLWPNKSSIMTVILFVEIFSLYTFYYCTFHSIYYMAMILGIPFALYISMLIMTKMVKRFRSRVALKEWYILSH